MDIIVADGQGKDIAVLPYATLELSYGEDTSNDTFTLTTPYKGRVYQNCIVYVEDTDFGGMITGYKLTHNSTGDIVKYTGYSWQGLLARHIVNVPQGLDRYQCGTSIRNELQKLFATCSVGDFFIVDNVVSVKNNKSVELPRYCTLYQALHYYLEHTAPDGRYALRFLYQNGKVHVNVEQASQFNVDERLQVFYTLTHAFLPINHLVCLGRGKLKDREVIHLYADAKQVVSTRQTFKGMLENATVYDYGSVEEGTGKLEKAGRDKFKEYLTSDSVEVTLPQNLDFNVGDEITVTHPSFDITVTARVTKKTVRIAHNVSSISYTVGNDETKKDTTIRDYE